MLLNFQMKEDTTHHKLYLLRLEVPVFNID